MNQTKSIDPHTGEIIASYDRMTRAQIVSTIDGCQKAFLSWSRIAMDKRAGHMRKLAGLLRERADEYALLATEEMGKVIGQAEAEIEKCAWVCEYFAEHSEEFLRPEEVPTEASKSYVTFQPIGIVLAVMPWNFPFYQVIRCLAPVLMAGNAALLKHASNVQGSAFTLQKVVEDAGFPKGLFANLNIESDQVGPIIAHKAVRAVTLTGSEPAGRAVAEVAGRHLKKVVLELGGSDPYIILDDVDLDKAIELCVFGRLQNNGQTCIAAKRLIVLEDIYDDFLERFRLQMENVTLGDPKDRDSYFGPLARHDLRDELHDQVRASVSQGAKCILGGYVPEHSGAYYPATILSDVIPGMEAFDKELFGPVASVIRAKDVAHAIALANKSDFGLGSGVLTGNKERGEKIALQIEAGNCFVNKLTASDPRLPFGGIKNSGFGRELSLYGIREFVNVKTIWID